jgi:hypothetical protein
MLKKRCELDETDLNKVIDEFGIYKNFMEIVEANYS